MNVSGDDCPGVPITLKFRMISVPAPDSDAAWNADTVKCPGLAMFGVISIPLLKVPATVMHALAAHVAPPAGASTAGL
jgi:hypothetical protein